MPSLNPALFISYGIAFVGGLIFWLLNLPLSWILGPVTILIVYKLIFPGGTSSSLKLRNLGFSLLGIQIGNTFQADTFSLVAPYVVPYSILSLVLIGVSLGNAYVLSHYIEIDTKTSMIGSVPGGLSAMMAVSDSMRGNTVLVTILHTIRLVAVLFIVPFSATHFFTEAASGGEHITQSTAQGYWPTLIIYLITFLLGYKLQEKIPASLVIVPMLTVGVMKTFGVPMFQLPSPVFILAQVFLGVHLGNSISVRDLIKAGKYCLYYLSLSIFLIALAFGFGFLLTSWTGMSLATAILSLAPGGLVEMALTATDAGGDPSVVSSLQMIRLLTIVLLIPLLLKWLLPRIEKKKQA
ncbi:AbrB family transcriptional regulator [Thalassobacillus sp. CUG 92003]|uniref:AbrB family transcriptional regulator n=1 Tax=Thalassobacillus sp. CUG 92003 TaxID=2736641 RepID=UPI0015E70DA3|nr:AbrB family transcriptional regulator [Thalassobacillus sp. CUG 92003]